MIESNVFKLSQPGTFSNPLTEVLRSGARSLLAHADEAEAATFLGGRADRLTEDGRRRLVRHGHLPAREIVTGIGPVAGGLSVSTIARLKDAWTDEHARWLKRDLKRRGLTIGPELAVADGVLGFWRAIEEVWLKTRGQRSTP